jgi:transcriptional regulator with XRE-family HTH domain
MKTTRELLGARIKELRKQKGLTQEQLAERVDLAARYISLIEVGRSSPSLETIDSIAATLGVELKELFDFVHLDPLAVAPDQMVKKLATVDERDRQILSRLMEWMGKAA